MWRRDFYRYRNRFIWQEGIGLSGRNRFYLAGEPVFLVGTGLSGRNWFIWQELVYLVQIYLVGTGLSGRNRSIWYRFVLWELVSGTDLLLQEPVRLVGTGLFGRRTGLSGRRTGLSGRRTGLSGGNQFIWQEPVYLVRTGLLGRNRFIWQEPVYLVRTGFYFAKISGLRSIISSALRYRIWLVGQIVIL